jgi:hypothetical protein
VWSKRAKRAGGMFGERVYKRAKIADVRLKKSCIPSIFRLADFMF